MSDEVATNPWRFNPTIGSNIWDDKLTGQMTVLFSEQADWIFARVAKLPHVKFDLLNEGCFLRAHEVARILDLNDVKTLKIFVRPARGEGHYDIQSRTTRQTVSWKYHVAVAVAVAGDQEEPVRLMIIDPSLSDDLLPVGEWLNHFHGINAVDTGSEVYFADPGQWGPPWLTESVGDQAFTWNIASKNLSVLEELTNNSILDEDL